MTATVQTMKTPEGNALVQRIVDAAADLFLLRGATWGESLDFLERNLETMADCEDFSEAGFSWVRMDATHAVQCQVAQRADERVEA